MEQKPTSFNDQARSCGEDVTPPPEAGGAPAHRWSAVLSSAALTGSRILSALAVNKIIAVYLGPGGLALVGQFQNFTAIVFGVTSGNITNAVITTVSSARSTDARKVGIGTALAIAAFGTGLVALCIGLTATQLAVHMLGGPEFVPVLRVLAVFMVPLVLNVVLLGVYAGLGRIAAFSGINIAIALASAPVCWAMIAAFGTAGAMASAVVVNGMALAFTLAWLGHSKAFPSRWLWSGIDPATAGRLIRLAAMTLSTVIALPAAQLLVRRQVIEDFGADAAGQWQAALKIGEVLLMAASVMVSLHFLPRFAVTSNGLARKATRAAAAVVLALAALGTVILAGSNVVLPLLFSSDFTLASALLPAQIGGDALRAGAMVLQAAFMSRLGTLPYVAVDLVYAAVLTAGGLLLVPLSGPRGAAGAVLAASVCSLCAALLLLRYCDR